MTNSPLAKIESSNSKFTKNVLLTKRNGTNSNNQTSNKKRNHLYSVHQTGKDVILEEENENDYMNLYDDNKSSSFSSTSNDYVSYPLNQTNNSLNHLLPSELLSNSNSNNNKNNTNNNTNSTNNNNSDILFNYDYEDNITDTSNHFDLYKQEPTIVYIKQKYKMYLDWLNENCIKTNPANVANQLNWYNYEQSFNSSQKSYMKYLENINNTNQNQKLLTTLSNTGSVNGNTSPSKMKKRNKSQYVKESSNHLSPLLSNLSSSPTHPLNQINNSNSLASKKDVVKTPKPLKISNLLNSSSDSSSGVSSLSSTDTGSLTNSISNQHKDKNYFKLPKTISSQNFEKEDSIQENKDKLSQSSKGVKFESINFKNNNNNKNTSSSLSNYISLNPLSNLPIKPILKSTQSSEYYYYVNTNNNNKNNNKNSLTRHESVASIGSSQASSKASYSSNLTTSIYSNNNSPSSHIKLPPIAKCSDDFYAVLNDLEKEKIF